MSERLSAAYEQVAKEVEKLVTLFYESQQNQQAFMTEAYRLLQAQSREVEEIRERAYTTEHIMQVLQDILKKIAALSEVVHININPSGQQQPQPGTMQPTPAAAAPIQLPTGTPQQQMPTMPYTGVQPGGMMTPTPQGMPSGGTMMPTPQGMPGGGTMMPTPQGMPGGGTMMPTPQGMPSGGTMMPSAFAAEPGPMPGEAVPVPLAPMPAVPVSPEMSGMPGETVLPEQEAVPVLKPVTAHVEVRFLHASPDAPGIDIYADGKKVVTNLTYESVSHYLPLEAGRHRLQVFPHGKTAGALIDTAANLKSGMRYTVAATGRLSEIRPIVMEDQREGGKPGFARLRVVQLSSNAPAVDITLPSGKVLISHLTYKEKSPYLQVAPGVRDLEVRLSGKSDVVLKVPKIKFDPNTTYTLYVVGQTGGRLVPVVLKE